MRRTLFLLLVLFTSAYIAAAQAIKVPPSYQIYAIEFAELNNKIAISSAAVGSNSTDSTGVCYMIWLIKSNDGKLILVDAGFTDTTISPNMKYKSPDIALGKLGIRPEGVTDIIITHPHWDHIGGIDLFPNAMVWMQKDDYNYFVDAAWQKGGNSSGFNKSDVASIVRRNRNDKLTLVKGDNIELFPGIKVFIGSKHTFESQYVVVGYDADKVIIASDNTWFYYNVDKLLPIPATLDAKAYTANLKRMKSMVPDTKFIIPGHDPLVFSRFPQVADGIVMIKP